MSNHDVLHRPEGGGQPKQIITGAHPKLAQRHRLRTHNRTYNMDDSPRIQEKVHIIFKLFK